MVELSNEVQQWMSLTGVLEGAAVGIVGSGATTNDLAAMRMVRTRCLMLITALNEMPNAPTYAPPGNGETGATGSA